MWWRVLLVLRDVDGEKKELLLFEGRLGGAVGAVVMVGW